MYLWVWLYFTVRFSSMTFKLFVQWCYWWSYTYIYFLVCCEIFWSVSLSVWVGNHYFYFLLRFCSAKGKYKLRKVVKINIITIFMVINCKVSSIKVMLSFLGVVMESVLSCPVCLKRVVVVDLSLEAWSLRLIINRVLTLLLLLFYWSRNVLKVLIHLTYMYTMMNSTVD